MVAQRRETPEVGTGRPIFSVVTPIYNEEETLPHFYARVVAVMEGLGAPFELVLVNDGSHDRSLDEMRVLHARDPRVVVVGFSRNFGHQVAISAGLDHARGDAVVIIDSDLQDPPEVIPALIAAWQRGAEVVYAQRRTRPGETRFKLLTAAAFYRTIRRLTSVDIPRDTGDFRLLDRKVVDALVSMKERHRFMRGLSVWVGFRQEAVRYDRAERFAGETHYPLSKMMRFALDAITGFSYVPLQLATTMGFILAGLSLLGIVVAAVLRLLNVAIQGQTTTLIVVLLLGGIQLIFLGIVGEYLGRIYDEVRARPLYIAREVLGDDDEARGRGATAVGARPRSRSPRRPGGAGWPCIAGLPRGAPASAHLNPATIAAPGAPGDRRQRLQRVHGCRRFDEECRIGSRLTQRRRRRPERRDEMLTISVGIDTRQNYDQKTCGSSVRFC